MSESSDDSGDSQDGWEDVSESPSEGDQPMDGAEVTLQDDVALVNYNNGNPGLLREELREYVRYRQTVEQQANSQNGIGYC